MAGIQVQNAINIRVSENVVILSLASDLNSIGIALGNSSQCVVRDNTISGSRSDGIHLYWSNSNVILRNSSSGATGGWSSAIYVDGNANTIQWNTCNGNASTGINIVAGNNQTLDGNVASQNGGWGILLGGSGSVYSNNRTLGNTGGGISAGTNTNGGGNF